MEFKRYDSRGFRSGLDEGAARRLAIESTQNIANLTLGNSADHADIPAVTELLVNGQPIPIAQVAKELAWEPERAAEVLARAGKAGLLSFSKQGDTTLVGLARK